MICSFLQVQVSVTKWVQHQKLCYAGQILPLSWRRQNFLHQSSLTAYNSCSVYTIHNFPLTSTRKHCLPLSCHIDFCLSVFIHVLIVILFAFTFTDDFPSPPEVCIIFYMLYATCICFNFISKRVQLVHVGGGQFIHDNTGKLINDSCCHNICNVFRFSCSVYR